MKIDKNFDRIRKKFPSQFLHQIASRLLLIGSICQNVGGICQNKVVTISSTFSSPTWTRRFWRSFSFKISVKIWFPVVILVTIYFDQVQHRQNRPSKKFWRVTCLSRIVLQIFEGLVKKNCDHWYFDGQISVKNPSQFANFCHNCSNFLLQILSK